MSRPIEIEDEIILNSARRIFLKHGFKASTSSIAKNARVSEGSIFKRFRTKADLFVAAMQAEERDQEWILNLQSGTGQTPIREALYQAAFGIIRHLNTLMPRIMALKASGIPVPDMRKVFGKAPAIAHARVIHDYFQAEIKQGRLQMSDPDIHAHALVGALGHYTICQHLFAYAPVSEEKYIQELVEIHVGGKITGLAPEKTARLHSRLKIRL